MKDYDIFYFDTDLSWEAESDGIVRTWQLFQALDAKVDISLLTTVFLNRYNKFLIDVLASRFLRESVN